MTEVRKRNWFARTLRYLAGLSPRFCYNCRTKLAAGVTVCPNCELTGKKLHSPYVPARIMFMIGAFLLIVGLSVYGLEALLMPYTRQYYIDALSMNYEKESYAGTLANFPLALGCVIIGLSLFLTRIISWFAEPGRQISGEDKK